MSNSRIMEERGQNNSDLNPKIQTLHLDDKGYIKISTNTIFDSKKMENSVLSEIPLIGSIFQELWESDKEIVFPKVIKPHTLLNGYYDFSFRKVTIEDMEYILWIIYDYTDSYTSHRDTQQVSNEAVIQKQVPQEKDSK